MVRSASSTPNPDLRTNNQRPSQPATTTLGRGLAAMAVGALFLGGRAAEAQMTPGLPVHAPGAGRRLLQQQWCSAGTTLDCLPCPATPTIGNDPCKELALPTPPTPPAPPAAVQPLAAPQPTDIQNAAATCASIAQPAAPGQLNPAGPMLPHFCQIGTYTAMQTLKQSDGVGLAMTNPTGWLEVQGNHFVLNGATWRGHGVNMFETSFNNAACASAPESSSNPSGVAASEALRLAEVLRRIDAAVSSGVNYIRLLMDTRPLGQYALVDGIYNNISQSRIMADNSYFGSLVSAVNHVSSYNGVFVELNLFTNPAGDHGYSQDLVTPNSNPSSFLPNTASNPIWTKLATQFAHSPRVIFGLANEPGNLIDTASLQATTHAIVSNIDSIRQAESTAGAPGQHLIKVPALAAHSAPDTCCGRDLSWWGTHLIARSNVIYSAHPYELLAKTMNTELLPYRSLPIIVDEFAPNMQSMKIGDAMGVVAALESLNPPIPYAAWIFHPNTAGLIEPVASTTDACGLNTPLFEGQAWGSPYLNWMAGVGTTPVGVSAAQG